MKTFWVVFAVVGTGAGIYFGYDLYKLYQQQGVIPDDEEDGGEISVKLPCTESTPIGTICTNAEGRNVRRTGGHRTR